MIKQELEKGQDAITSATIAAVMEGTKDYDDTNMNAVAGPSSAFDDSLPSHPHSESPDITLEIDPDIQQDLEDITPLPSVAVAVELEETAPVSGKGKGKGWRKGMGKPKPEKPTKRKKNVAHKVRMPARKMDRYDCRGAVVINIHHDDKTAYFVVTHALQHPDYVDVVGNRLRGARFVPKPLEIVSSILPPVGSIEFEGQTPLEKFEKTLEGFASLVKDLKSYKGGGGQEIAQRMYDSTEELRKLRTSTLEVLAKAGNGKPNSGPKPVKRTIEDVEGALEQEARNAIASGSKLGQQIDQQFQEHLFHDHQLHQAIMNPFDPPALLHQLDGGNLAGSSLAKILDGVVAEGGALPEEYMTGYVEEVTSAEGGTVWLDPAL